MFCRDNASSRINHGCFNSFICFCSSFQRLQISCVILLLVFFFVSLIFIFSGHQVSCRVPAALGSLFRGAYLRSSSSQSQSQSHSSSRQAGHSSSLSCQYSQETGTHWDVECTLSMAFSSIAIVSPMSLLTMVRSKKWPYACRSMSDSFARRSRLPS